MKIIRLTFYILLYGLFRCKCLAFKSDYLDSFRPRLVKILDFPIEDSKSDYSILIDDIIQFGDVIFCCNRKSIYIVDKNKNELIQHVDGIQNPNHQAATKLVIHKNKLYAALLDNGIYVYIDNNSACRQVKMV